MFGRGRVRSRRDRHLRHLRRSCRKSPCLCTACRQQNRWRCRARQRAALAPPRASNGSPLLPPSCWRKPARQKSRCQRAARAGVSVVFDDVDGVRQAVAKRTRGDLRSVLEAECTEEVARTSPGRYLSQLIDVIGGARGADRAPSSAQSWVPGAWRLKAPRQCPLLGKDNARGRPKG
jgi:hypothetical protein